MRLLGFAFVVAVLMGAFPEALGQTPPSQQSQALVRLRERDASEVVMQSHAGLSYRIMISAPRGQAPPNGFPVFYVLDGDGWFETAVQIARVREWGHLPPSIIVGIGYPSRQFFDGPRRNYDFTPPGSVDPDFDPHELGGADAFLEFLTQVVKPWLAQRYRLDPEHQTLFGHSMGALFVLHAMYTAPQSFNVYLAASPPIRFSNRLLVREASAFEQNPARRAVRALITVGALESRPSPQQVDDYRRYFTANPAATGGLSVEEALRQTFPPSPRGFDKVRELRELAAQLKRSGANVTFAVFDAEEHTASAVDALNRGVPFALRPPP
jgi:hypothetical protein